jgi:hypothetical protein
MSNDKLQVQIDKFIAWKEHPCTVLSRQQNDVILSTPIQMFNGTAPAIIRMNEWDSMPGTYYVEVAAFGAAWHPYVMDRTDVNDISKVFDKVKRHFARKETDAKENIESARRAETSQKRARSFSEEIGNSGVYYDLVKADKYSSPEWNPDEDPIDEARRVSFKINAYRDGGLMSADECKSVVELVNAVVRLGKFAMPSGVTLELSNW